MDLGEAMRVMFLVSLFTAGAVALLIWGMYAWFGPIGICF